MLTETNLRMSFGFGMNTAALHVVSLPARRKEKKRESCSQLMTVSSL